MQFFGEKFFFLNVLLLLIDHCLQVMETFSLTVCGNGAYVT